MRANVAMLVLITAGLMVTSWRSLPAIETYQYTQLQTEACVVNADYATTPCLWNFYPAPNLLQPRVAFLRAQHDAIFGENYQRLAQPIPYPAAHALVRYYDSGNGDYLITTAYDINFYGPYTAQSILGYLYDLQQPGTHALYGCITSSGHHFVSLKAACPGGTYERTEGWLLNKPTAASGVDTPLYGCTSGGADFVSPQAICEGQTSSGALGYALMQDLSDP